jgi:hypothetical protein
MHSLHPFTIYWWMQLQLVMLSHHIILMPGQFCSSSSLLPLLSHALSCHERSDIQNVISNV